MLINIYKYYNPILYNWDMSYKALYRTYRPNTFDEVIGQEHITSTLQNIIANDKIGHAYLFAGPRGTGKTSVAHVFARAVNKNAAGQEVFGDMDIIEIDAASNNGVAEVRSIIDNVNYAPTSAKYKVYIIDEVHMLTKGAFNALLKTLEEPPAHVIFILATTEPHKIPVTILSRTQRFNFRRIDDVTIGRQLVNVLTKENIKFDAESIKFISKLAQGGMRDALSIADQASAYGNGTVSFEAISQVFGIISIGNQISLFNKAYSGNAKELIKQVEHMLDNGADIERLSSSMLDILKDFIILKKTGDDELLSFINSDEASSLILDTTFAYKLVDILIGLISTLRHTSVPRQSFELAVLKMVNEKNIRIEPTDEVTMDSKADDNTINIFDDTQEVEVVIEEQQVVEEPNMDESRTADKTIEIVNAEQQEMSELDELQEDILSTQEIPMGEIPNLDSTSEIDIMKLFDTTNSSASKPVENKATKSVDEILNLLVQADKETRQLVGEKWNNIQSFIANPKYKHFAELLMQAKIISAGKTFILVSSEHQYVIDGLIAEDKNQEFIRFIYELIGHPMHIFAINKIEFNTVKETWKQLASTDSLPLPREVEAPQLVAKPKTEEEEFGSNLFGDLFSL